MQNLRKRRRQVGPVIIAVLFLLAACGISIDFFAGQVLGTGETLPIAEGGSLESPIPPSEQPVELHALKRKPVGRMPSSEDDSVGEVGINRNREYAVPELSIDNIEENYKISLAPNKWNKRAQLLPNPMLVSELTGQLSGRGRVEVRGGGWLAIDIAKSEIFPIELFEGRTGMWPVIEARRLDGREIVTSSNTGFPIVRGIADLRVGRFEVFENPPCLVRFGGVVEDEICEVTLRNVRIRYRFEAPVIASDAARPENVLSTVSIDRGLGHWLRIGSFNESFYPIGDANRDGHPDFYAESVTGADESGLQMLLVSRVIDEMVEYVSYEVPFKSAR
jgi:hypothetical protein